MTEEWFLALDKLAHLQRDSTRQLVRLVLRDGVGVTEAAARLGMTQPAASQAMGRVRQVLELASVVAGAKDA